MLVNNDDPPEEFAYQLNVPLIGADAPTAMTPSPQRLALIAVTDELAT